MKNFTYKNKLAGTSPVKLKQSIFERLCQYESPIKEGINLNTRSIIYHGIKVVKTNTTYSVRTYQEGVEGRPSRMIEVNNVFILKLILESIHEEFIEIPEE